jgi:hypothetical protein
MKSIVNKITGETYYCTVVNYELQENEIAIDELLTIQYVKPFFNFKTREYYEGATQEEIENFKNQNEL